VLHRIRSTILVFVSLTIVTGIIYPVVVTVLAQTFFRHQANGSLVYRVSNGSDEAGEKVRDWWGRGRQVESESGPIGSERIGQHFSSDRYFWSRPSATGPVPYNAAASTGSNYGPTNPSQLDAVKQRVEALRKAGHDERSPVPIDLVTASASGLDPHISPGGAEYQVPRIARSRRISEYEVRRMIAENVEHRPLGLLGEPRVNVLRLNLALDEGDQQPQNAID
jgi:K+-transporting ATPase ATPase C chain